MSGVPDPYAAPTTPLAAPPRDPDASRRLRAFLREHWQAVLMIGLPVLMVAALVIWFAVDSALWLWNYEDCETLIGRAERAACEREQYG